MIVATVPVRPLALPQFQPCGSEVHVPKFPVIVGEDFITVIDLLEVTDPLAASLTVKTTVKVPGSA